MLKLWLWLSKPGFGFLAVRPAFAQSNNSNHRIKIGWRTSDFVSIQRSKLFDCGKSHARTHIPPSLSYLDLKVAHTNINLFHSRFTSHFIWCWFIAVQPGVLQILPCSWSFFWGKIKKWQKKFWKLLSIIRWKFISINQQFVKWTKF